MDKSTEILMRVDQHFSEDSQKLGIKAWENNLADEAVMVTDGHQPYLIGKSDIIKALKNLYSLPELYFEWHPIIAQIAENQDMGFTTGTYIRTYSKNNIPYKEIGKYTTIWKKINDKWKIILDIGNELQENLNLPATSKED